VSEPQQPPPWGSPYAAPQVPPAEAPADDGHSAVGGLRIVGIALAAGVVLGVVGGYLWSVLAEPAQALVTEQGVFIADEVSYDQQVVVSLWFLVVGVVLGAAAGFAIGLLGRRSGPLLVIAVLLLATVGCVLSVWLGVHVFGPDPEAALASAEAGDTITAALDITSDVVYLGWPIGSLAGLIAAVLTWKALKPSAPSWSSSTLPAH